MFGVLRAEQGEMLAWECISRGLPPLSLVETYHIIQDRLSMKADAMLAGFNKAGGRHKIIEYSPDACEVHFTIDDQTLPIRITWEDAKNEKWPFGKNKQLKDNWATPMARQDMLWARTVSRGVRRMKPEVVAGRYTPEEISDFAGETVEGTVVRSEVVAVDPQELIRQTAALNGGGNGHAVTERKTVVVPTPKYHERLDELFAAVFGDKAIEARAAALKKRGVASFRSLSADDATALITTLESKLAALEASKLPENVTSCPVSSPCTQADIDRIKTAVGEIAEKDPEFPAKYKARLVAQGKQRTADLSIKEASAVFRALSIKNLSDFFGHSLPKLVEMSAADVEPPPNSNGQQTTA